MKEETGLDVKNITYFGNQPWPYPSGLMVGFIADYAGGEINLQDEELSSGDFYTRDNLPELPRKLSLARKMIDWWIEIQMNKSNMENIIKGIRQYYPVSDSSLEVLFSYMKKMELPKKLY